VCDRGADDVPAGRDLVDGHAVVHEPTVRLPAQVVVERERAPGGRLVALRPPVPSAPPVDAPTIGVPAPLAHRGRAADHEFERWSPSSSESSSW
jgi:hypothetical protein